ncbi:DUF551 domain-containing protein [Burkholderia cenocepacia]|uniref:DUF551 domain-containing protein n=1 Tax=Burkholderia cenocepacia TaxID=95486 RepID=UPI0020A02293|nr:DUF551 domain-containing protein [Burkholderia cenocepacia]MCO8325955.1 hypothetical protein [Burkholderia cenocepacia]MCO8333025.1 hypothetical protein [Burkholderia cenocepacia]MCO8340525.1 hypothetical protein [Burkholderia cenocepacia]MCO8347811.1 hypothetical protein [Burkholderia cenocepacia]MCO8360877.1 hypothetical protein [Burkholderia cenocepacia]
MDERELKEARDMATAYAREHARELAAELLEWSDTALLCDGRVRELARMLQVLDAAHALTLARSFAERAALELAARRTTPDREAWQPIETAPRDGTQLLLSNGVDVEQGWWMHDEGGIIEHRDMDGRYTGQTEIDGFIGWWDVSGCMEPEPTHWMPLPTAPTSDKGGA